MEPRDVSVSAWIEHAPFAFWLIEALYPRLLVELGTHTGYSYFCFCQAVQAYGTGTECHAVDTWRGDEHAGFYDDGVFAEVERTNGRYADFSTLHRKYFNEALDDFGDGTVDLLHIDGRHRYEDVREDFATWLPKLAERGVVLFHDTQVRRDDFGVHRCFGELAESHPHIDFPHCHGLGVLAPKGVPEGLEGLLTPEAGQRALITALYARLGSGVSRGIADRNAAQAAQLAAAQAAERVAIREGEIAEVSKVEARFASTVTAIEARLAKMEDEREGTDRIAANSLQTIAEFLPHLTAALNRVAPPPSEAREPSRDWKGKSRRARNRVRESWRLIRTEGPIAGGRLAARNWSRLGRIEGVYADWVRRCDTLDEDGRRRIEARIGAMAERPLISVVMPVYDAPANVLRAAIASVRSQIYPNWELCIADDASPAPHVRRVLDAAARSDARIRVVHREENGNISAASNSAVEIARGEWIALMDHDDLLPEKALASVALALAAAPDTDIAYSDEDKVDGIGRRSAPYFKPDFSIEHMLGQNLINHLGVYRASLVREAGGFREGFEGSQDHDLALRCIARSSPERVLHIPEILYHWRQGGASASFSEAQLERCVDAAERAANDYLKSAPGQVGAGGTAGHHPIVPAWLHARWPVPEREPLVSVIVPTRDAGELVEQCVGGVLDRTDYARLEVLIVDNGSTDPESLRIFETLAEDDRVRVLPRPGPFNYSAINNEAVREARGELVLLLNNDIDVIGPDWLSIMVSHVCRPGVGGVGAKLLYADGRVQHAGVRLGAGTFDAGPGVAGHYGTRRERDEPGYFGAYVLTREVAAVTGACALFRREALEAVDGLDETLAVAFNDVDLCLRVRREGWRIVQAADAVLFHLESASRGADQTPEKLERFHREARLMRSRWGPLLDDDPFYNRNFDNRADDFTIDMRCAAGVDNG